MKIETKFNEGDAIFFISDAKKVCKSIVRGIKIEILKGKKTITNLCSDDKEEKTVFLKVDDTNAFPSKEKLIESL